MIKNANVEALEKIKDGWQLILNEKTLEAKLVILAGGTHSPLRQTLGIHCETHDYHQSAIVAVASTQAPHQNMAYERFAGKNTLAILPLSKDRIGTVLTVPSEELTSLLALDDKSYMKKIEAILGKRLGKFIAIGPRQSYPLIMNIADKFVLENLVLLGNVAHTFNPVGAQGLNLGLAGAKNLVENLTAEKSLADFENTQRARCEKLKKFTHQTVNLFSSEAPFTRYGRRLGLLALEHCVTIKNKFILRFL